MIFEYHHLLFICLIDGTSSFISRHLRGKIIIFNEEQSRGECITSAGEALLRSIKEL